MSANTGSCRYDHDKNKSSRDRVFSRRDSVATAGAQLQDEFYQKLADLRSIWNEVGMTEDQRRDRLETAVNHVRALLDEMVDEETCMRDSLRGSLDASKKEMDVLLGQLNRERPDFLRNEESQFTLLELEEKCRVFKDELTTERSRRIGERDHYLAEYALYRRRIGAVEYYIDRNLIPTDADLEQLRHEAKRVKETWESNIALFKEKRANIMKMIRKVDIDIQSLTRFQRDLVSNHLLDENGLVLSRDHMQELEDLENLTQSKYTAYLDAIRQRMDAVKTDLIYWWDQCHVPAVERERFQTVDPVENPEQAMEEYIAAIAHWKAFYESRKTILDKLGDWERLWQEYIKFEERERDVNRYNNRGGALLQEEKRRKKVPVLLTQVQKQLSDMVTEYDLANPNDPFLMDGVPIMEYIDSVQHSYHEKKRKEKEEKEMMKKQQLMTERMYGATASTPGSQRKRLLAANSVTPSKHASPRKEPLSAAGKSWGHIHSSLAGLRSPGLKLATQGGSSTKKPPTGLPIVTQKRKVLADYQEAKVDNAEPAAEGCSTISSTVSYGEFANAVRAKGLEGQSSFITGQVPPKIARLD